MSEHGRPSSDPPWVLGYSASHNGAVCLLRGSEVFCAVQEERLAGTKRARIRRLEDSLAFGYCLDAAGIKPDDLAAIVGCYFSGNPTPGASVTRQGWTGLQTTIPHHLGHAVGAFVQSGLEESAILIIDGQGGLADWLPESEQVGIQEASAPDQSKRCEIVSIYHADSSGIRCLEKHIGEWLPKSRKMAGASGMPPFGSLGGMYSAAAHQIFGDANDAGKVMGLAAFGQATTPRSAFFSIDDHGAFHFSDAVRKAHHWTAPWPDRKDDHADLAASVQAALEEGVLYLVDRTRQLSNSRHLCYAGGVALNCVANELIVRDKDFDQVYFMAAAEDSGPAIGAAYYGLWQLGQQSTTPAIVHDSAGRSYTRGEIDAAIQTTPQVEPMPAETDLIDLLCDGGIVGWFNGGSELGPRALGQRSILADPRPADAKERLNRRVKHREPFRPFAPLVLAEEAHNWFELPEQQPDSPLMLRAFRFRPEAAEQVPAVVHHDGTGRLQTITESANPALYGVLRRFFERTGVPIIVNTSFNVMGEPIVETPQDALWSLLFTDLDAVAFGERLVRRTESFTSFLDLKPRTRPMELRFRTPFGATDRLGDLARAELRAKVETPWGQTEVELQRSFWPLLDLADGQRSGRELLRMMNEHPKLPSMDEFTFASVLRVLRRKWVVDLMA